MDDPEDVTKWEKTLELHESHFGLFLEYAIVYRDYHKRLRVWIEHDANWPDAHTDKYNVWHVPIHDEFQWILKGRYVREELTFLVDKDFAHMDTCFSDVE